MVPTPAKNPDGALLFEEFIHTPVREVTWANSWNIVPTSISVCKSAAYLSSNPLHKVYVQLALNAKWVPVVPGAADILKVHFQFMNDALNGVKTPHDALAAAQDDIERIMDRNLQGT